VSHEYSEEELVTGAKRLQRRRSYWMMIYVEKWTRRAPKTRRWDEMNRVAPEVAEYRLKVPSSGI
jgi:hypothetical protein